MSATVSGVSHSVANIVGSMLNFSEMLSARIPEDCGAWSALEGVDRGIQRLTELCRDLQNFHPQVRVEAGLERIDLSALVDESRALLHDVADEFQLCLELAEGLPALEVDSALLRRSLECLVAGGRNRLRGAASEAPIGVRTGLATVDQWLRREFYLDAGIPDGACVFVEVSDAAPTMDDRARRFLFTRYSTNGSPAADGATVASAAAAHGGALLVGSTSGNGNRVALLLSPSPAHLAAPPSAEA